MELEVISGVPSVTFGKFSLPFYMVKGGLRKTVDELRKRSDADLYRAILDTSSLHVSSAATAAELYLLTAAVVKMTWYEMTKKNTVLDDDGEPISIIIPRDLELEVDRQFKAYSNSTKLKARQKEVNKVGKQPKQGKNLVFGISSHGDRGVLKRGTFTEVYDSAVAGADENKQITEAHLVEVVTERGIKKRGEETVEKFAYGIRWVALQLVKSDHLFIVGTQAEIPGTPKALPKRKS